MATTTKQLTNGKTLAVILTAGILLTGCTNKPLLSTESDKLRVITTTALLRDLVQNVGGQNIEVVSLVPDNADPHSYEPTLRDARNIAYADVAFSNYALLEEQNIIRTLDANLRNEAVNISLVEESVKYAAELIPLVENVNLDTVWLGMRAHGDGQQYGATRTSQVFVSAIAATGPGNIYAYLTGSFGDTEIYFNSADGFDASNGYRGDTMTLPADAHTHLSWVFTEPGIYTLTLSASLQVDDTAKPTPIGENTFTFAVAVNAPQANKPGATLVDQGHADLTVNLESAELEVRYDPGGGGEHSQHAYPAEQVVIDVPAKALDTIPAGKQYSFLGKAGENIYQLPQAVLGKHVHGEIDPHLWQNVRNTIAYVNIIRDTLISADPDNARAYRSNTSAYLSELEELDDHLRETLASIPEEKRYLVTTHDAFGYLAHAYGINIAGFVTPNPATEPSLADRRKLSETLKSLEIQAVFLEPNLVSRSSMLTEVAEDNGVRVCTIYGDTFSQTVTDYRSMMQFNAETLKECLS